MELERKVYDSWAFTENEQEKGKINREIYQELCSKYKILKVGHDAWGKKNEPFSIPTSEELANNDFVYARRACYARGEYKIYKCPNELTLDEIALICDEGSLCFGYTKYKATRTDIEISED